MGTKGAKRSEAAKASADRLVDRLRTLGDVRARGMFGGYGVFADGVMFALVNSQGVPHLRTTPGSAPDFEARGVERHGKMPYYEIPEEILAADEDLVAWAKVALAGAIAAKRG